MNLLLIVPARYASILLDNNDESIKMLFENATELMSHWGNNVGYRADNIEDVEQISKIVFDEILSVQTKGFRKKKEYPDRIY
jgi:hypothetical protein